MYFVEEHTQSQIAEVLGCSQMQVSRLLRRAVRQLRRHMLGRDISLDRIPLEAGAGG